MLRRSALLTALLLMAACAPRATQVFGTGPDGERTITLRVNNRNFGDATIWALRFSDRMRAGVVTGKGRADFRIPWTTGAPLRVEIRLLSGETCLTREVRAEAGDVIPIEVPVDVRTDPDCTSRGLD